MPAASAHSKQSISMHAKIVRRRVATQAKSPTCTPPPPPPHCALVRQQPIPMSKTTSADDGLAPSTAVASAGVAVASSSPQQGSTLQRDITAADGMVDAARRAELEALLTEKEALLQCRLVEHQRLQAENAALAQECRELRTKYKVNAQRDANYQRRMVHHEARRSRLRSAAVTAVRASAIKKRRAASRYLRTLPKPAPVARAPSQPWNMTPKLPQPARKRRRRKLNRTRQRQRSTKLPCSPMPCLLSVKLRSSATAAHDPSPEVTAARRCRNAVAHPQLTLARVLDALEVLRNSEADTVSAMKRLLAAARCAFDTDEEFDTAMAAFRSV